ncbi:unnamed protein product, partial [Pylaiella littoralis]
QDGSTKVTTEAVHPFHAFKNVQYQLDWTPTPKRRLKRRKDIYNVIGGDRRLDLDMTKCGDSKYFDSYLDPFNIEVRDGCVEWAYDYDLFNFNYAKDCSLKVHIVQ